MFQKFLNLLGRKRIVYDRIDNEPYLERYYLFLKDRDRFPFNIFLHKFLKSDIDDLHDHPWPYATLCDSFVKAQALAFLRRKGYANGGGVGMQGLEPSQTNRTMMGPGTEVSDSIPATVDGQKPAALSSGEFVMSAEVPKLSGEEILQAINQAGLEKREQKMNRGQGMCMAGLAEGEYHGQ